MREILFKAKRLIKGDWIEGHYHYAYGIDTAFIAVKDERSYPVELKTRSQYINKKDKNGVKIFENDIIKGTDGKTYKIVFDIHYGQFVREGVNNNTLCLDMSVLGHFKVIGNIFDNKELIENV